MSFAAVLALACVPQDPLDHLLRVETEVRSHRTSSCSKDPNSNADNLRVPPGQTHTLCELTGPGVIRHVWLTFPEAAPSWLAKNGGARPDEIVLRCYWDGADTPAVEAPVGDFFACGFGRREEVRSATVVVEDGDSYNCFWPMPFAKSARITLTNESEKPLNSTYFHVDWESRAFAPGTPFFCAQYRQEFPATAGQDYLILDAEGAGHYVGTVLSVRTRSPEWFGEGDDRFYIDGEEVASIQGTGTEDYFLSAWGLKKNSMPYSGTTVLEGGWGHIGQRTSAYRWHVPDPVHFAKSLRVCIEHKGWVPGDEKPNGKVDGHTERFDDFASVAFWYQQGQPKRFATLPPAKDRVPPNLDAIVEGKALLAGAVMHDGDAELQGGPDWTGDGQILFRGEQVGSSLEVRFTAPAGAGVHRALVLPLTRSYDFGVYRVLLDGEEVARGLDLYSANVRIEEIGLGTKDWGEGEHVLRFVCTGKNSASAGYFLGLDSVRLRERLAPR
ncbi:MAG: glycoside hydrolase family 172 protein [Planctomycetota bacterium]